MAAGHVVLGFDFGGTKIAVAACDLDGVRLDSVVVDSRPQDGAEAAFARGLAAGRGLLAGLDPGRRLAAIGAATFGIPFDDHVDLAPSIPGWEQLAFGTRLRQAFPTVPIRLSTDVKAAAAAEVAWGALAGFDPALYLNLGTGLAAAIVTGGDVLAGAHGAAGEIGYNIRDVRDLGGPGADRILLEDAVSGRALAGSVRPTGGGNGRQVTAAELFDLAATRPDASAVVEEFVLELGLHVANLAVAVDPARIAVGGGMVRSWARLEPGLRRALDLAVPFPPELVPAAFPYDAPLIGALAIGIAAARGPRARPRTKPEPAVIHPPSGRPSEVQR